MQQTNCNTRKIRYNVYDCNEDDSERYLLGTSGERVLFSCGLNCSTANRYKSDPTVAKSETVSKKSGYDSFMMINLIATRSTDFNLLPDEIQEQTYRRNIETIMAQFRLNPEAPLWCAWGASIRARRYFVRAAMDIVSGAKSLGIKLLHFGPLTAEGHPRHASRLDYAWIWGDLDPDKYLDVLRKV